MLSIVMETTLKVKRKADQRSVRLELLRERADSIPSIDAGAPRFRRAAGKQKRR